MHGKGIKDGFHFGEDHRLDLGHLKEMIKYHGDVLHMIVEAKHRAAVESAIKQAPEDLHPEIVESRKIHRAYFHFKFTTHNRDVAKRIKKILDTLPAEVMLTDYAPDEHVDPEAEGTEAYTAVHEYTFKGKGVIEGEPHSVREVFVEMVEDEFVGTPTTSCCTSRAEQPHRGDNEMSGSRVHRRGGPPPRIRLHDQRCRRPAGGDPGACRPVRGRRRPRHRLRPGVSLRVGWPTSWGIRDALWASTFRRSS